MFFPSCLQVASRNKIIIPGGNLKYLTSIWHFQERTLIVFPNMPEDNPFLPPTPSSSSKKRAYLHAPTSPAKRQSKWTPEEDALIIQLRGIGKKWDDISKALPGRSPTSCRLRYQNYLERQPEWDEDRKNLLAMLYERYEDENRCSMNTHTLSCPT